MVSITLFNAVIVVMLIKLKPCAVVEELVFAGWCYDSGNESSSDVNVSNSVVSCVTYQQIPGF